MLGTFFILIYENTRTYRCIYKLLQRKLITLKSNYLCRYRNTCKHGKTSPTRMGYIIEISLYIFCTNFDVSAVGPNNYSININLIY